MGWTPSRFLETMPSLLDSTTVLPWPSFFNQLPTCPCPEDLRTSFTCDVWTNWISNSYDEFMAIPYLIHHIWTNWISNCQLWTNWISNSWIFMAIPPSFRPNRFTHFTSAGKARKMCRPRWSISKGWSWYQLKNLRTSRRRRRRPALAPHSPGGNGFCWKSAETPKEDAEKSLSWRWTRWCFPKSCPGIQLFNLFSFSLTWVIY